MTEPRTEHAYKYCESVTREHAKSFYFAAKFLPRRKQRAVFAIYAFCRHVDDEVDESGLDSENQAAEAVEEWKRRLDGVYAGDAGVDSAGGDGRDEALDLVFTAWKDILRTYPIPQEAALDLTKGVLMDTHKKRYETFDELYVYCYRVASTVGLMSSEILGPRQNPPDRPHARPRISKSTKKGRGFCQRSAALSYGEENAAGTQIPDRSWQGFIFNSR